jgi:hypothetical protein
MREELDVRWCERDVSLGIGLGREEIEMRCLYQHYAIFPLVIATHSSMLGWTYTLVVVYRDTTFAIYKRDWDDNSWNT